MPNNITISMEQVMKFLTKQMMKLVMKKSNKINHKICNESKN